MTTTNTASSTTTATGLESNGTLTAAQSQKFITTMLDESKIVSIGPEIMADAATCLHWYQRPFAAFLISNPLIRKIKALVSKPSKWDRRADKEEALKLTAQNARDEAYRAEARDVNDPASYVGAARR